MVRCNICGKELSTRGTLKKHYDYVHPNIKFTQSAKESRFAQMHPISV